MLELFSQAFWIGLQRQFFLAFWLGFALSLSVLQPACAASPPKTLNVVSDDNFPPYIYRNPSGEIEGYLVDLWRLWEQKTGVKVTLTAMNWAEAQKRLLSGEADVIDAIYRTPARDPYYHFSSPYTLLPVAIFIHKSISGIHEVASLRGFQVAVQEGDACIDHLEQGGISSLVAYKNYSEMIESAIAGKLMIFCMDEYPANYYLLRMKADQDFVKAFELYQGQLHRAVRKGQLATLEMVEEGMAVISPEEKVDIEKKWLKKNGHTLPYGRITFSILVILLVCGVVLLVWIRLLRIAVRRKTAELEAMINALPDLLFRVDRHGRYLDCWTSSPHLLFVDREHFIGRTTSEVLPKEAAEIVKSALEEADRNGRVQGIVYSLEMPPGRLWFELSIAAMHDPDEKDRQFIVLARDITERMQTLEALKESEERFKALHNASFGGIGIHDQGLILACNLGLSAITGYSQEELVGMDGLLLIAPGYRDMVRSNIKAGYEKPYEAMGVRKNGEEYPLRLEARNIPYKGKMVRTTEFRDITDYKRYEAEQERMHSQLVQAQKMESVGRLAGGVAHDFNNMLGVILGYSEMVLDQIDENQPIHSAVQGIHQAAERSAELTRQLLAFARKQTVMPKVLDLNETVRGMLNMLRRLIGEDIDLAWVPGRDLGLVKIDPSQVDQVLANLCVNSRDAIGDTGKVTIETSNAFFDENYCSVHAGTHPGEYVMLVVSDNGCGMDAEALAHLFEPFFTTKEMGKGTGLGLAMVYGIVKQNNGFINVYSEPGQGTSFKIYLPKYVSEIDQAAKTRVVPPAETGLETILLVEDEPMILAMTTEMLHRLGYTVLPASTPKEALLLAEDSSRGINLLMTDVVMPEMNGRDLAKSLLALNPDLKCLFMSGYTANVIAHHGVLDKGISFLQKPFSRKDLAAKVRETLDS
jgi:PAS domain S-box-containing protein